MLGEIQQRRPDWPGLALPLGDLNFLRGRYELALEYYQKAIAAGNRSAVLIQQTNQAPPAAGP